MEKILIFDFGSQYTQLIARRIREQHVYCEIHPFYSDLILDDSVKGIVLSGSPASVHDQDAPQPKFNPLQCGIPVLAICYGAQWIASTNGGNVGKSAHREYGRAQLQITAADHLLFDGMDLKQQVWMSHGDSILELPPQAQLLASTDSVKNAAYALHEAPVFALQFHPEVTHSTEGKQLIHNFLRRICKCTGTWTPDAFVESTVAELKKKLGNDRVIMGLSGGVDSTVAAVLIQKAIGENLHCIFINNGLLRHQEYDRVLHAYRHMGLNIRGVDASERFYEGLKGVEDPEKKRKVIGRIFVEVFEEAASELQDARWLGQGTIYPDVIESVSVKGPSVTIKSHHNVGGLPEDMKLKVVEPLNTLFKDEVRVVGATLGIDPDILNRHPFPGPGLGIRILGEVTPERVAMLQQADDIFLQLLKDHQLYEQVWQAGAIFLPVRSVGVMGDERTYEHVVALRAVQSVDGMTADWVPLPYEFLATVSSTIINQVKGINRVVYDISSKPPATIEWE